MGQDDEVTVAFDMVLEAVESAIAAINSRGAEAFRGGKHDSVRELTSRAEQMIEFRSRVYAMRREWPSVSAMFLSVGASGSRASDTSRQAREEKGRKAPQRLQRGLRTPQEEFRLPILQALVDLGGHGPMDKVLESVGLRMQARLNTHDLQAVKSNPKQIRWRTSAKFERYEMVKDGLLSGDSNRGIWEITAAGREALAAAKLPK